MVVSIVVIAVVSVIVMITMVLTVIIVVIAMIVVVIAMIIVVIAMIIVVIAMIIMVITVVIMVITVIIMILFIMVAEAVFVCSIRKSVCDGLSVQFEIVSVVVNALEFVGFVRALCEKFANLGLEHAFVVKGYLAGWEFVGGEGCRGIISHAG